MNLATILVLLKIAVSMLANPNLVGNPALQQQATMFASEAIGFADQALAQPAETMLGTSTIQMPIQNDNVGEGSGTPVSAPTTSTDSVAAPAPVQAPATKSVSVAFALSGNDGFVTVTNIADVVVRVKGINVTGGTLADIKLGASSSVSYSPSFTDAVGKTFVRLTCDGLGSIGKAKGYGGDTDPCVRKDNSGYAVNELQPGEVMILRYVGSPTGATYQPGSVVEVDSGNEVTF